MRKTAQICALLAGLCTLGIAIYLLAAQPSIDKDWLGVWVDEMEIGSKFDLANAHIVTGVIALCFAALTFFGAYLISNRFVAGAILIVLLDMFACMGIAVSPDPKWGVLVWMVPGLLMAAVAFLLGMELQRTQPPEGMAELE